MLITFNSNGNFQSNIIIDYLHRIRQNDTVKVHLDNDEPTVQINETDENNAENLMTVEVLGDMPKVVNFEGESTIQVKLFIFVQLNLIIQKSNLFVTKIIFYFFKLLDYHYSLYFT